jgi:murein DD-endopeptidase MepM/ murein hydrolase activator NlpD
MRFTLLLFLIGSVALMGADMKKIEADIKKEQSKVERKKKSKKKIYLKLDDVVKSIKKQTREVGEIDSKIATLNTHLKSSDEELSKRKKELMRLEIQSKNLTSEKKIIEQKFVTLLAKELSLSIITGSNQTSKSIDGVVNDEVLDTLKIVARKEISGLRDDFSSIVEKIESKKQAVNKTKLAIETIKNRKKRLTNLKESKVAKTQALEKTKRDYKKDIQRVEKEQEVILKTLARLNIIKKKELKRIEEEKRRRKLAAESQNGDVVVSSETSKRVKKADKGDVKKVGSSYQSTKVRKYKGPKTRAPIKSFKIVKKFGPYYDPIYKIKIFNESVVMRSNKRGDIVRSVLPGKIVFAQKTSLMNNVVIIEHSRGLHTIYANMTKLSSRVKEGKKIPAGYKIGKIDRELKFQVTQKSYYVNPLDLIKA